MLIAAVTAVTAASIGYNLATDGNAARPARLRMIRGGGFDTRYLAWGRAGSRGSPIVLVPGAFETADTFAALGPALGLHHRVFAIDLSGTGYSVTSPPFDASHLAAQLLAFVRAMHLTGANAPVLVGHSSGAAVVGMAVLLDRAAAAGIVFLDGDGTPLPFPPVIGWVLINPYRTTLARRPLEQPGFLDEVAYEMRHGIPSMSVKQLRALRAVAVPKAVIYGRNDPQLSSSDARATAVRIGALRPVAIPGRHLTMISSPRQLAAALSTFARLIGG